MVIYDGDGDDDYDLLYTNIIESAILEYFISRITTTILINSL